MAVMARSEMGRKIHGEAASLREAGDFVGSIKLIQEAFVTYLRDGDVLGAGEVLADKSISLRHLGDEKNDINYVIYAKHVLKASIEMVEKSGDKTAVAVPYFNLGKVQESLGEYNDAVYSFKKALENMQNNPPYSHQGRPAIVADYKIHLAVCEFRAGDKSALERAQKSIEELENIPVDDSVDYSSGGEYTTEQSYNKNVWLSGGYMHLAEALKDEDSEKAMGYLAKARQIIDSDPKLEIRKKQLEKLIQYIV